MTIKFSKYHALGNDYIVLEHDSSKNGFPADAAQRICHRHLGIGSDGLLIPMPSHGQASFGLKIINPDGSEAEKSGNGLRIFARYLWDRGLVQSDPFTVATLGGIVTCTVLHQGRTVSVAMGRVSFDSRDIPVSGPPRQVLRQEIELDGQTLVFSAATIGNPHCVVLCDQVSAAEAQRFGPLLETHPQFPHRTNVQFVQVLDRNNLRIEIWERGAGYTLASGSSSCAAAAVAHRLDLCDSEVAVHMPGGSLNISMSKDFQVRMTGAVVRIAEGTFFPEALNDIPPAESSLP